MSNTSVRVRFPPSPTGDLHVGNMRSALFNWAYARHTGGTFVFRIEDTDAARSTEESYWGLLDDMRWLGLDWDEGPEIGGPYAPYRQSERADIYTEIAAKLLASGRAYEAFSTPEEVEARHRAAGRNPKLGYDNFDRDLTDEQKAAYRAEGRPAVLRFRVPDEPIVFDDLVRGETSFAAENVPDFALTRGDGSPLYTLTNPIDDATQHITHIVRGDDLLSSTARQIPLHRALRELGIVDAPMPLFGRLPMVMGEGNQRLSKRKTPEASLRFCRERGFLPEGLKNYLALLGWAIADDNDVFSVEEMCAAFDVTDVNASPARFDVKKCEAINATWIRRLSPSDFAERLAEFLHGRGVNADRSTVDAAAPLVQERITVLEDAVEMLAFLFVSEEDFAIDPAAAAKQLGADSPEILGSTVDALDQLPVWSTEQIEAALREALIEGKQLKPRKAFGPVRVAISGRAVSPPLFESMELLGRERTMRRLRAALA